MGVWDRRRRRGGRISAERYLPDEAVGGGVGGGASI